MEQEKDIDSCPICLDKIGEKNNCITECGHKFCLKCLSIALQGKNTCPMCRAELVGKSDDAAEIERLSSLTRTFARENCLNRLEIDKYKNIYMSSMMKIQDDKQLINEQNKEIKKLREIRSS